ncbi:hypothetical protein [Fibrella forsythiae]|uniref:Uncharacterized protein n=1 Tax=Fibrella forsythiae TaxID=2817061 RepID=A0ABS3JD84_9BACT|nr:hypothetical protein [Fibrella forsythiae]MBO0947959.1 hypothetical protein [Fibrella forsythiae]
MEEEQRAYRRQQTIDVPAHLFSDRLSQVSAARSSSGSVYSRLALIHQVAKTVATEAVSESGRTPVDLTIDELTDPPLYEGATDTEPVIIRFSYTE